MFLPSPPSTLFPYTTLFRSHATRLPGDANDVGAVRGVADRDGARAGVRADRRHPVGARRPGVVDGRTDRKSTRSELQSRVDLVCRLLLEKKNLISIV